MADLIVSTHQFPLDSRVGPICADQPSAGMMLSGAGSERLNCALLYGLVRMCLRYPNARLAVLERLVRDRNNCAAALLDSARDFGLLEHSPDQPACIASCQALQAAKAVIESTLVKRGIKPGSDAMSSKVESIINKVRSCLVAARQEFEDKPHAAVDDPVGCGHFAPLVMDCMLQHLQPYL